LIGCREYCCCASLWPCKSFFPPVVDPEHGHNDTNNSDGSHRHDDDDGKCPRNGSEPRDGTCSPVDNLSRVGRAVYDALHFRHFWHRKCLWNVSTGTLRQVCHTPYQNLTTTGSPAAGSDEEDTKNTLPAGHSHWLPEKLYELLVKTESWCDILGLGPPDGLFLEKICEGLRELHDKNKPIIVRILFGNVLGMPVNCEAVVHRLTKDIPPESTRLWIWVGAWRKNVSWNHSKILAVDGRYLWTGGHNWWDRHYLRQNPVRDLSVVLEGDVAHDGHLYANDQWKYVETMRMNVFGKVINRFPDWTPMVLKARVHCRRFPMPKPRRRRRKRSILGLTSRSEECPQFPPAYSKPEDDHWLSRISLAPFKRASAIFRPEYLESKHPQGEEEEEERHPSDEDGANAPTIRILSIGRYGKITRLGRRPSDDAMVAMLDAAQSSIKLAIQDLGPVCIPGSKVALPGTGWPRDYLQALGRALYKRRVTVHVVVSNPISIPGGLKIADGYYGNGTFQGIATSSPQHSLFS